MRGRISIKTRDDQRDKQNKHIFLTGWVAWVEQIPLSLLELSRVVGSGHQQHEAERTAQADVYRNIGICLLRFRLKTVVCIDKNESKMGNTLETK